ncbi:MAG: hypothetical protein H7276_18160 [Caulobacter sp.]|nr:hypothetical protein [Vitreoscilla sp.]
MLTLLPRRWPTRAILPLALTAILAACATPPPAKVATKPTPEHSLPEGVKLALAQRFPQLRVVSDSSGLLPAPGADQIAVVLGKADGTGEFTVALVTPDGTGGWRVADASRPIVPGCAQCSVSADLAPHGLYVRVIRSEGADFENFTYQFAPGVGVEPWRLVNVTAYVPARPEDPASHGFSASVDLLSGQRTDITDDATTGTPVHRERQSTVALRPPIAFGEFSFAGDALDAETRALPPVAFDPAGTLSVAAVDALRQRFPQMTVQSQASGALRADGGRDIAAVLVPADRAARPGAAADAVVAVLLAQPDGGVRLADVSGGMAHDYPTWGVQVQIARRVLSVQTTDVNATGSVSTDYQFAFRTKDTSLRLVALRSETTRRAADGRQKRSEQKARLASPTPVPLTDFTFDPATLMDDGRPEPALASGGSISGS